MFKICLCLFVMTTFSQSFAQDLSLKDLGFDKKELKVDLEQDRILKKRAKMLSTHQILGLTTIALMTAAYLTAEEGGELEGGRTEYGAPPLHKWLGIASGLSYFTTAGFAFFAPEAKGEGEDRGSTKWHKRLAWIHFPAMLLTTTLGLISDHQFKSGKRPTGLVAQKALFANIAYFSVLAAGITMTFNF